MLFNESPEPSPPGMLAPGWEDKVMHASFTIGGVRLMADDGCGPSKGFEGMSLHLALPTTAEVERAFAALSAEGTIKMPLGKTFWSPCFGMVTDRFGVAWFVSLAERCAAEENNEPQSK